MQRRPVCLVCLVLMLCMCILDAAGFPLIRGNPLPESVQEWIVRHPNAVIRGEVAECLRTEYSLSACLKQVFLTCGSEQIPIENVKVFFKSTEDITEDSLPAGMQIEVSGKLEEVGEPRNPGEFDSKQYYACQHIYYFMKNGRVRGRSRSYSGYRQLMLELKGHLAAILKDAAGEDAGVFEAMLLGEKTDLDNELKLRYQMGGMSHILAISGLHISILGMGLFELLKRTGLGNVPAGMVSLTVMLQYGILTGGSVSAMRAVCMFLLTVGGRILGRSYDLLTALSFSAILLLLESPAYLYSASFLLSFGAVAGLGAVSPVLTDIFKPEKSLSKSLLSSGAVQLATLPLMLKLFGEISVAGIFLNLAVLPTVSGVMISGVACVFLGLVSKKAALLAALPGRALLFLYEKACELAGKLPFCTWIGGAPKLWQGIAYYVIFVGGLVLAYYLMNRRKPGRRLITCGGEKAKEDSSGRSRRGKDAAGIPAKITGGRNLMSMAVCVIACSLGILILSFHPKKQLTITCLDVGQGDGVVITVPDGGTLLSDCGSSNKKNVAQYQLLPFLKNQGIRYLDAILVSHTDDDHISGIRELLEFMGKGLTSVRAGTLILPQLTDPPDVYGELESLAQKAGVPVKYGCAGEEFYLGDALFRFLWPETDGQGEDVNENCMVTELIYKGFKGLFTGDIGEETEQKLMDRLEDVDFLKVAHHGSKYSTGEEFLEAVRPEAAVASSSATNTYGHPSPDTLARLEAAGCRTFCTKDSGAVTIITDGEHIRAEEFLK